MTITRREATIGGVAASVSTMDARALAQNATPKAGATSENWNGARTRRPIVRRAAISPNPALALPQLAARSDPRTDRAGRGHHATGVATWPFCS